LLIRYITTLSTPSLSRADVRTKSLPICGAGAGVLIGALVALLLAPRVSDLLFDVDARDPLTFGGVALALLLVALCAAAVPALRATRCRPECRASFGLTSSPPHGSGKAL